jgi:hypothetical protein
MLRQIANVHDSALFEMAVADVEVSVSAIDRHATATELAPVESVVIVIELQEGDAVFAVFK